MTYLHAFTQPHTGELAGSVTAVQMPNLSCKLVKFKAAKTNTGLVYIGRAGVTKADGTTDTTTGWYLAAGEETDAWLCLNLNEFYRICDNATDNLIYICWE